MNTALSTDDLIINADYCPTDLYIGDVDFMDAISRFKKALPTERLLNNNYIRLVITIISPKTTRNGLPLCSFIYKHIF